MYLREAMTMAFQSLRNNRLRSLLTTLGIVIGVAAVILLVGLGNAVKSGFNETFGAFASQINISKTSGGALGSDSRNLTYSDVRALQDTSAAPDIASVTPVVGGPATVTYGQRKYQGDVTGSTTDILEVANRTVMLGSMFTQAQYQAGERVTLLGPEIAGALFGDPAAALGKMVRIQRTNFRLIGVLDADGQNDNATMMPLGAARRYLIGGDQLSTIIVRAADTQRLDAAEDQIRTILDRQHAIQDPSHRDYSLQAFQNQIDKMNQTITYITYFTVSIAGISLLVGGIGVANIMLVSVTERTREIGIRKALGARRGAIMKQFLIEAVVLAGVGGVLGELFGISFTLAAGKLIATVAPAFGQPTISVLAGAVALAFSLVIGLSAGGYPALRAARLRPIDALRFQ
ncbi:MAG TPA: ABC transporter permease [Pseudonocardia sp.]|uniref:ABC transporter permease n=1 Tax=Pseudonocardia sp. TaxID=60912 RepID=UPI002CFDB43D|nr:ABC transporter permease [Pseudonocardia sp.]HTF51348.1 ABC transporter permease [Pseudonocardia sp.]